MLSGGSPLFSYLNNGCLVLCCDWGLQAERDVFVAAEITCRSSTAMMAVKKERRLPTANCIIIAPKRLKLRLSGSARKSQKRFRDTPRFKFQAGLARTQPFLSRSAEKRGDQSRFKCRKMVNYYAIRSTYRCSQDWRASFQIIKWTVFHPFKSVGGFVRGINH
jgi:hypothetical protein